MIPTRDRPARLARCLASVRAQDAADVDLVVVDDGSHDRAAVAAAAGDARVVRAPGRGPAAARNLGARAAIGEVICFTDDDCVPAAGWMQALAAAAASAGAAAGRTVAPAGASAAVRASQAIVEGLTFATLDRATGRLGFAPSCNLAVVREALAALPFDESFPRAAGEDRDWSDRAAAAGLALAYAPDAVVVHAQELDAAGFVRQHYGYGRGATRYRAGAPGRRVPAPGFYARLVRRGFREGPVVGGLVLGAQAITAAGVVAERLTGLGAEGACPASSTAAVRTGHSRRHR